MTGASIDRADGFFIDEDKVLDFTVFKHDGVTRQPVTGWAMEWTLRLGGPEEVEVITKTTTDGITILDASQGLVEVAIDAADTADLAPGLYFHVLRRTGSGNKAVLAADTVVLQVAPEA